MNSDLRERFEATTGDARQMWEFYSGLTTTQKLQVWDNYPQYRETLRAEERKEDGAL